MMNPEHPSNDDDVIELTDEVPIELTPADEVLEPMRAEKPVFPGIMREPIEVETLPSEPFKLIKPQATQAPETQKIPLMEGLEDGRVHDISGEDSVLSEQERRTAEMQSQASPKQMRK